MGGMGGRAGLGYSWSETYYTDGVAYTQHHSSPGGFQGSSGRNGRGGAAGRDGNDGRDGRFHIFVKNHSGATETFMGPYDLISMVTDVVDTLRYNVIEPGAQIHVSMSFRNCGDMPTPGFQRVWAHFRSSAWVRCTDQVALPTRIKPGEQTLIERPIIVDIADQLEIPHGKPLLVITQLEHRAVVERVNQEFQRIRGQHTDLMIRHAVEASIGLGADSIVIGDEAPLLYQILNLSHQPIGHAALPFPRFLSVKFSVQPLAIDESSSIAPYAQLRSVEGRSFGARTGMMCNVAELLPHAAGLVGCTVQFSDPAVPLYSRVRIDLEVYLGRIRDLMNPRCVQVRSFEVQLAESYSYDPTASFLLVVNNRSQLPEVQAWQQLVESVFRCRCAVWNLSLYGDFNSDHVRLDGRTLLQDFCGGTIIFLNNHLGNEMNEGLSPVGLLRDRELFVMARDYGIHTIIVGTGQGFDLQAHVTPATHEHKEYSYFKDMDSFLKMYEGQLLPGAGSAQPQSATADCDLCGCVKRGSRSAKQLWMTMNSSTQTLCVFDSPKSTYPDRSVYLGNATLICPSPDAISDDPHMQQDVCFSLITGTGKVETFFWVGAEDHRRRGIFNSPTLAMRYHQSPRYSADIKPLLGLLISCCWHVKFSDNPSAAPHASLETPDGTEAVPNRSVCQGYMYKRGKLVTGYRDRLFTLHTSPPRLTYETSTTIKTIPLSRYQLEIDGSCFGLESGTDAHLKFQIATPDRTYFLKCHSVEEKDRWIHHLKTHTRPTDRHQVHREHSFDLKREALQRRRAASESLLTTPDQPSPAQSVSPPFNPMASSIARLLGVPNLGFRAFQHNTVIKIAVNQRHFVRKASEAKLREKAFQLSEKLRQNYPNQNNIVVYRFNPLANDKASIRGLTHNYGTLEIHRALDASTPHITWMPCVEDELLHSPDFIHSPATIFSFFKTLDFDQKLLALDQTLINSPTFRNFSVQPGVSLLSMTEASTLRLRLILRSILSDIADEQAAFRKYTWSGDLSAIKVRQRLHTLQSLLTFEFRARALLLVDAAVNFNAALESAFGLSLLEIFAHVQALSLHSTSVADVLLPRRRNHLMNKITKELLQDILVHQFDLNNQQQQARAGLAELGSPPHSVPSGSLEVLPPSSDHFICRFTFEGFEQFKLRSLKVPREPPPTLSILHEIVARKTGLEADMFKLVTPNRFLPLSLEAGLPSEICVLPATVPDTSDERLQALSPLLASKTKKSRLDSIALSIRPERSTHLKRLDSLAKLVSASWSRYCLDNRLPGFTKLSKSGLQTKPAKSADIVRAFRLCSDLAPYQAENSAVTLPLVLSGLEFDQLISAVTRPSRVIERKSQFATNQERIAAFTELQRNNQVDCPILYGWQEAVDFSSNLV